MEYDLIEKIRNREFSFREDLEYTSEDVNKFFQKLVPIFKITGLNKIIKKSERVLGDLNQEARNQVASGYTLGTIFGIKSLHHMYQTNFEAISPYLVISVGFYGLSLLHHIGMSQDNNLIEDN